MCSSDLAHTEPADLMLLTTLAAHVTALATLDAVLRAQPMDTLHGHWPSAVSLAAGQRAR